MMDDATMEEEEEEPPNLATAETLMEGAARPSCAADTSQLAQTADAFSGEETDKVLVQQTLLSELKSMMQAVKLGCRVDEQCMWDLHESLGGYNARPETLEQLAQEIAEVTILMQSPKPRQVDASLHGSKLDEAQPVTVETDSGVQPQPCQRHSFADTDEAISAVGEDLGPHPDEDKPAAAKASIGNSLSTMPLLPTLTNAALMTCRETSPNPVFDPTTRQDTVCGVYDKGLFTSQSNTSKTERVAGEVTDSAQGTRRWLSCLFCHKRQREIDVVEGVASSKKHRIV